MKISVFGLGYVGCVSAACFAKKGNDVIGVDINQNKVDMINDAKSPIVEKDLDKILLEVVVGQGSAEGTLSATTDQIRAVIDTDVSLVCVGTPSEDNGSLNLQYVKNCARDIGKGLKQKDSYHVVVARSTMLPGSVEEAIIREIEYVSGKKVGLHFGAVMNPEFLRESTSVYDFYNPPVTVIGEYDSKSGDMIEALYGFLTAPTVRTTIRTAEMVKYACNSFHGLKVAFANEIGAICKPLEIDSHDVMDIFCMDTKLNLSSYYLKPGFAFGGSCLPKDLRAINYKAQQLDIKVPALSAVIESNDTHVQRTTNKIIRSGSKNVGILGLSFKAGTDDLRESPIVTLTETLIGKGFNVLIYDQNVSIAKLFGANKEYIEHEIPHISSLMRDDLNDVLANSDVLVIGNKGEEFAEVAKHEMEGKVVYDLVRITDDLTGVSPGYDGIGW